MSSSDCKSKIFESEAPYIVLLNEIDDSRRNDICHDDCSNSNNMSLRTKKGVMIGISLIVMAGIISCSVLSKHTSIIAWSLDRFERMAVDENILLAAPNTTSSKRTEEEKMIRSYFSKVNTNDDEFVNSNTKGKILSTKEIRELLQSLRQSISKAETDSKIHHSFDDGESIKNSVLDQSVDTPKQNDVESIDTNMLQDLIARSVRNEKQRAKDNKDNDTDRNVLHEVTLEINPTRNEDLNKEAATTQTYGNHQPFHKDEQSEVEIESIADVNSNADDKYYKSTLIDDDTSKSDVKQVDSIVDITKNQRDEADDYYRKFIGIDRSRKSRQKETTKTIVDESNTPEEKMAKEMIQWSLKKEKAIHQKLQENVQSIEAKTPPSDEQKIAQDMVQWSLKKESIIRKKRNALAYATTTIMTDTTTEPSEEEKMAKEMERWSMKKQADIKHSHDFVNKASSTVDERKIVDDMVRWSLKKETTIRNDRRIKKFNNNNDKKLSSTDTEEKMAKEMLHWSLKKESAIRQQHLFGNSNSVSDTAVSVDEIKVSDQTEQTSIQ
jgi:hypothetical protein